MEHFSEDFLNKLANSKNRTKNIEAEINRELRAFVEDIARRYVK